MRTPTDATLASLNLLGNYVPQQFIAVSDNNGGTLDRGSAQPPNAPPPAGTTADMIMRDGNNGDYEIYDLGSNSILGAAIWARSAWSGRSRASAASTAPTPPT